MNPEPRTSQQWATWLDAEEKRSLQLYTDYPERLVSDSNQERQVARDYAGREILELLQNANDAATDAGKRGRVRIELSAAGLIVANEGAPFTRDGVASLKLANFSPKRTRKRQMVGNKGLGFRAVLNWTRTPLVLSDGLALAFSAAAAQDRQQRLAGTSEKLRALIAEEQKSAGALIVPLLAFPGFRPDGEVAALLDDDAQRTLHTRAMKLRAQGFTTVIAMPFDGSETHLAEARQQLAQLRPEVLLFARSIAALEIAEAGEPETRWRHEVTGDEASRVHISETEMREWRVFRRAGEIAEKLLPPDRPAGMDYEVVLAVPTNHEAEDGVLYSYFPTELSFPYPVVAHATLDLQANRQQPQSTAANQFILGELAGLMAETAERLAREQGDESGLALLATNAWSDPLAKFEFRDRLCTAAKLRVLIPTIAAGLATAATARRTKFADTSWLPQQQFQDVAKIRGEAARKALAWLGVAEVGALDWLMAGWTLTFANIGERADYIAGLIQHQLLGGLGHGALLLDTNGTTVPATYKVFLRSANLPKFELPAWYEARFLHDELRQALWLRLNPGKQELFTALLAPLGVVTYSLGNVIDGLVLQARRLIEQTPASHDEVRRDLLRALHGLFPVNEPRESRTQFPSGPKVFLPTLGGTHEDARKVYLSASYGPRGRILEDLYGSFASEKLLAPPESLGFSEAGTALVEFLRWLGVADAPSDARVPVKEVENAYDTFARQSLTYPIQVEDYHYDDPNFGGYCSEVASVDDLPNILTHAPAAAVLAWLATDTRAQGWKGHSREHGRLCCRRSGAHNTRHYDLGIPSYVRWKLQTTAWLPTRNGKRAKPEECLAEPVQAIADLFPIPARLTPDEMKRYGLVRSQINTAFDFAGVLPGFSQIEVSQLYDLLLSLPERDKAGTLAKSVYQTILNHFTGTEVADCETRKRFIRQGKILARCGGDLRYCEVKKAWHLNTDDLPAALRHNLNIAELPKSARASRVAELFGIGTVERAQIVWRIRGHTPSADAGEAANEIAHVKPLIRYLRNTQTVRPRDKQAFEQLRIVLCAAIDADVEFQGASVLLELNAWGWILDDTTHTAYLLADPGEHEPLESPLFANAVGEIFAEVFGLERGTEFAQLVQCRKRDRLALLKKCLRDETVPGWEELERQHREEMEREREFDVSTEALVQAQVVAPAAAEPVTQQMPSPPPAPVATPTANVPLQIQSKPHTPRPPAQTIALRITQRQTTGSRNIGGHQRVSGDFCEEKVVEFEKKSDPPRYPLHVGGLTGWNAFGVDILSFDTAEKRAAFLAAEKKDEKLVARFIEVKGRRDSGAKIDLRDNELTAARSFGKKYYLYRVFERGDGSYGLAILKDPLNDSKGRRRYYEVNLDAAARTEEFNLVGGLTKEAYMQGSRAANRPAPTAGGNPISPTP